MEVSNEQFTDPELHEILTVKNEYFTEDE